MRAIVAYDASPRSEEAASLALSLNWPAGTHVRVIAVLEPPMLVPASPFMGTSIVELPEVEAAIREHLAAEVDRLVGTFKAAGVDAGGAVLRGRPGSVLVDEARAFGAELLIAGSRGHGAIASLVLGSVSGELVDHAPCPVLVARRPTVERVLFATDGSESAAMAEHLLASSPLFADVAMRVVSVAEVVRPWHTGIAPTMYHQVLEAYAADVEAADLRHRAVVGETAGNLTAPGRKVDVAVRSGDAAAEIVAEASEWRADLVVLGSRGLAGLSRMLIGSVARNVLLGSDSSVLIVRGGAPASEGGGQQQRSVAGAGELVDQINGISKLTRLVRVLRYHLPTPPRKELS
jgi:nucleotide-binding universal stress UspA family protein